MRPYRSTNKDELKRLIDFESNLLIAEMADQIRNVCRGMHWKKSINFLGVSRGISRIKKYNKKLLRLSKALEKAEKAGAK